jgi:DNA polymerase III subunit chi
MVANTPVIIFLSVANNATKLEKICSTVYQHYEQKERVLITVPSQEAALYIDQLLWRSPEESFLPHLITETPSEEPVVITTVLRNLNQAKILLNLCPEASGIASEFSRVYELLDLTHPSKEKLSRERQAAYRAQTYFIETQQLTLS